MPDRICQRLHTSSSYKHNMKQKVFPYYSAIARHTLRADVVLGCPSFVLQGTLDTATGEMNMNFEADFVFTVGPLYKAPALKVATVLTSESSSGEIHSSSGSRLQGNSTK